MWERGRAGLGAWDALHAAEAAEAMDAPDAVDALEERKNGGIDERTCRAITVQRRRSIVEGRVVCRQACRLIPVCAGVSTLQYTANSLSALCRAQPDFHIAAL